MAFRVVTLSLLVALLGAQETPPAPAPAAQETPSPPIRVEVNEVIVPVTVTDDRGRFVSDLEASDFRILDEGRPQRISYFTRERGQPVVIGFLMDMSNATRIHWKHYQEAAMELIFHLLPGDPKYSGFLISYSNEAELLVNTTTDSEKLAEKIRKMKPGGGAALYDAIHIALTNRKLVKGEPIEPRRILIIIGDGHDTASKYSLQQVLEIAQRELVTIHALSTVAFGFSSDGEKNLERLCGETGGRVMYPLNNLYKDVSGYLSTPSDEGNFALKVGTGGYAAEISKGIINAIAAVAGEVTTQYILRYIPDYGPEARADAKVFRNIEVKINNLPNVRIRARKGYYPIEIKSVASR
jgi:VWFA-related protein